MHHSKTEILDRQVLKHLIHQKEVKHAWLANVISVSEKSLSRWLNGEVTRIRTNNLIKLAKALNCHVDELIAHSETDTYSSDKNTQMLINELNNDNLLYELLISSKVNLAISLIKSIFHTKLPSEVTASFLIKLGYAALIQRKYKKAFDYFNKALAKSNSVQSKSQQFSANLALAITHFFDSRFSSTQHYLMQCTETLAFDHKEKAHYLNTHALYYLYIGNFHESIRYAELCIEECTLKKLSIEKNMFLTSAWHLKGAAHLFIGETSQALQACQESVCVAKQSRYKRSIAAAKAYLAAVQANTGNHQLAVDFIQESLKRVDESDISFPSLLCIAAYIYMEAEMSVDLYQVAERHESLSTPNSITVAFIQYQLYRHHVSKQQIFEADQNLQTAIHILKKLKLTHWFNWFHQRQLKKPA